MIGDGGGYRLVVTGPAARTPATRPPDKVAAAVQEFMATTLLDAPHRLGRRLLLPPDEGTRSARRGAYRVLFEIDDDAKTVIVTAIEHRADAYRSH